MDSNRKPLLGSNGVTLVNSWPNSLSRLGLNILVEGVLGVMHNKQAVAEEMNE